MCHVHQFALCILLPSFWFIILITCTRTCWICICCNESCVLGTSLTYYKCVISPLFVLDATTYCCCASTEEGVVMVQRVKVKSLLTRESHYHRMCQEEATLRHSRVQLDLLRYLQKNMLVGISYLSSDFLVCFFFHLSVHSGQSVRKLWHCQKL